MYMYVYVFIHKYIEKKVHTIQSYIHSCIHTYIHTHNIQYMGYLYLFTYIQVVRFRCSIEYPVNGMQSGDLKVNRYILYVCMYVCMYVCI